MGYYIDLKRISIDDYKEILKGADLIPSRTILKENADKNFAKIKGHDIRNLDELQKTLKNKKKLKSISEQFDIEELYLEKLRAEINGYIQKPNRIKDFSCINEDTKLKLEEVGLQNTVKLYDEVLTDEKRKTLSTKTGISYKEIMLLAKLTDLSRIRWVNHTFAYVLLEAGYDTTEKVAIADYLEMYDNIKQLNAERKIYNAHIGARDMKRVVDFAKNLDFEILY